jgi:hypothetical protein
MTRARLSVLALVLMTALPLVSLPAAAEARAGWSCKLRGTGMQDYLWSSAGDGSWADGTRWAGGSAPASGPDSYVCIRQAVTVTIGPDSGRIDLRAFELGNRTTLVIEPGTELYVSGGVDGASLARAGSVIVVHGATIGGTGHLVLRGTLRMMPAGSSAARLATGGPPGQPTLTSPSRLLVDDQGRVEVMGDGASLLTDGYTVQVRGWVGIGGPESEQASLAADPGTSFELAPRARRDGVGTLALLGDQGYSAGGDGSGAGGAFVNGGLVTKIGGNGVSRISADYSSTDGGRIAVEQGSLLLPDGTYTPTLVSPGATYGSGVCDSEGSACGNGTTEDRPQTATLRVPAVGDEDAQVVVTQVEDDVNRVLGDPVKAHARGVTATRAAPFTIELRYDSSLLMEDDGVLRTWRDLAVKHKDGGRSYGLVPPCTRAGDIPATSDACVDRNGAETSSRTVDDDAVMVIRTIDTSRWIAF